MLAGIFVAGEKKHLCSRLIAALRYVRLGGTSSNIFGPVVIICLQRYKTYRIFHTIYRKK